MMTLEKAGIGFVPITDQAQALDDTRRLMEEAPGKPTKDGWDAYWKTQAAGTDPTYLKRTRTFRYNGKYVLADEDAEARFASALRHYLYTEWFGGLDAVAEFGCGSGNNLNQLASTHPGMALYGYDWSQAAVDLVRQKHGGGRFDMRNPTPVAIDWAELGVLTHGAMEQLGDDFMPFYEFLLSLRANVYVHVEPLMELYGDSPFDRLATEYHIRRGYLGRFLTQLRKRGDVQECRTGFGNRYNEGYMVAIWRKR